MLSTNPFSVPNPLSQSISPRLHPLIRHIPYYNPSTPDDFLDVEFRPRTEGISDASLTRLLAECNAPNSPALTLRGEPPGLGSRLIAEAESCGDRSCAARGRYVCCAPPPGGNGRATVICSCFSAQCIRSLILFSSEPSCFARTHVV